MWKDNGLQLLSGLLPGLSSSIGAISMSLVIFASYPSYIQFAIRLFALSNVFCTLLLAVLSSSAWPNQFGTAQQPCAPVMVLMLKTLEPYFDPEDHLNLMTHFVAALAVTSLIRGIIIFLIGWFGLSNLVQCLPYPVMAGFLVLTGLILLDNAIQLSSGLSGLVVSQWSMQQLFFLLPALALWTLSQLASKYLKLSKSRLMLGQLVFSTVLFYAVCGLVGGPIPTGWQVQVQVDSVNISHVSLVSDSNSTLLSAADIHWQIVAGMTGVDLSLVVRAALPAALSMTVICVIKWLLTYPTMEQLCNMHLDYNFETKRVGLVSITLIALFATISPSLGQCAFGAGAHARRRLSIICLCLVMAPFYA
jgi:SulP family sulfate permease